MISKTLDLIKYEKIIDKHGNGSYDVKIINRRTQQLDDGDNGEPGYRSYYANKMPRLFLHYCNGKVCNINKNHPSYIEWDCYGEYIIKFFSNDGNYYNGNLPAVIRYNKFGEITSQFYYYQGVCLNREYFDLE